MVYRVVATKLTEEEHTKLLDACNQEGCTPSTFIKNTILEKIIPQEIVPVEKTIPPEKKAPKTLAELMRSLKKPV